MQEGLVFNVQKFSTEDGPGIRTTVFMKSCPLRCAWCHNPEAFEAKPQLVWHGVRCMGDHACIEVCPNRALSLTPETIGIDRRACEACGTCTDSCPTGALEIIGKLYSADALLAEVRKDEVFYETSGGGVTISGGEPMAQHAFVRTFASRCKLAGLHVALDTSGHAPWDRFEQVLPFVDLVLFDLKVMDSDRHRQSTGVDNVRLLDNAKRIAERGIAMWIRTPVIPGHTDDDANLHAIGRFIREELPTVERWELLAYTNLGLPKYRRLGLDYPMESTPLLTSAQLDCAVAIARAYAPEVIGLGATKEVT